MMLLDRRRSPTGPVRRRVAAVGLAALLATSAGLLGGCGDQPTYCEQVAVVFSGNDPHQQLAALRALADRTTGQESADWQALHSFVQQQETGSGPVSTVQVDAAVNRLDAIVGRRCGTPG